MASCTSSYDVSTAHSNEKSHTLLHDEYISRIGRLEELFDKLNNSGFGCKIAIYKRVDQLGFYLAWTFSVMRRQTSWCPSLVANCKGVLP